MRTWVFAFPQDPFDATSGAAVSTRLLAQSVARNAGILTEIRAPAWREGVGWLTAAEFLRSHPVTGIHQSGSLLCFDQCGVRHWILCAPRPGMSHVNTDGMAKLLALWDAGYSALTPDLMVCYGSSPSCHAFRSRVQAAGGKIAFLVHNEFFTTQEQILPADLLICPSRFIGESIGTRFDVPYTICPPIVEPAETLPSVHEPVFATFVNPQPIKGVHLFAALVAETLERGMDCPFLVVGGRADLGHLHASLMNNGIRDKAEAVVTLLERCKRPADFLRFTRCLLVPSLHEAAGRVVVEAAACGIPAIVSNRGGLPETTGNSSCVVPIPASVTPDTRRISAADVKPWADHLQQLMDSHTYRAASIAAKAHGITYSSPALISPMLEAVAMLNK